MKKTFMIVLVIFLAVLTMAFQLFAERGSHGKSWSRPPMSFVNIYRINGSIAAGMKGRVWENVYVTGNVQYRDSISDLEFQAGAVYMLPFKVLFFRFYGGSGLQLSRNEGFQYPYVVLGTDFLFFFSEVIHPLSSGMSPKVRGGFSFHF